MSPTRREMVRTTRARVVEAAGRLTCERGPNGFSMDVLAKEAGVARATVYEHFRSKRAVLDELASSISSTIALEGQREPDADPLATLRNMLGEVCRHWAETEDRMRELRRINVLTGVEQANEGVDAKQLRRIVEAIKAANHLRSHWSVKEATDALSTLMSYSTYEQLRHASRTPQEVESVLAKLVIAIVSPSNAAANGTNA